MKLTGFEIRWADTLGHALVPRGICGGVVDDLDLGELFRLECLEPPWYSGLLLRFSLWLAWLAPLWMLIRLRTFGGLSPAEREAVLEKLLKSASYNVRMAAMFLKLTVCTLLLGDERLLRHIGAYDLVQHEPLARRSLP
jgi:hypothetical protein